MLPPCTPPANGGSAPEPPCRACGSRWCGGDEAPPSKFATAVAMAPPPVAMPSRAVAMGPTPPLSVATARKGPPEVPPAENGRVTWSDRDDTGPHSTRRGEAHPAHPSHPRETPAAPRYRCISVTFRKESFLQIKVLLIMWTSARPVAGNGCPSHEQAVRI